MTLEKDMPLEIEIKLKVDSFELALKKLKSNNAEFKGNFLQTDAYYDDNKDSLVSTDRCLRIRTNKGNGTEVIEMTYKGQRQDTRFKSRREIGIKVEKAEELAHVFENLGYCERLRFEKKRSLWDLDNCIVTLDELPMVGKFIEIEGPSEDVIEKVQKKLGLDHLKHMPSSYAHLIENKLKKQNNPARRITF